MLWRNAAVVALALVLAGPALAHFEILEPMIGFSMYAVGGLIGMIATIGGLFSWARSKDGARAATVLGFLPAAALIAPMAISLSAGHPRINDISSDLDNPPALANGESYPSEFAPIVREHYTDIKSLELAEDPAAVRAKALYVAREREGWTVTEGDKGLIQGTDTSQLFRFKDDFSIRVRKRKGGSVVDMRSRSRDGQGDFGVNAARIEAFFADLQQAAR